MIAAIVVAVVLAAIWSAYGPKVLLKTLVWTAGIAAAWLVFGILIFSPHR